MTSDKTQCNYCKGIGHTFEPRLTRGGEDYGDTRPVFCHQCQGTGLVDDNSRNLTQGEAAERAERMGNHPIYKAIMGGGMSYDEQMKAWDRLFEDLRKRGEL